MANGDAKCVQERALFTWLRFHPGVLPKRKNLNLQFTFLGHVNYRIFDECATFDVAVILCSSSARGRQQISVQYLEFQDMLEVQHFEEFPFC